MNYLSTREELVHRATYLMEEIKNNKLKLHINHIFPLEQAKTAHMLLESRLSSGKILLKP